MTKKQKNTLISYFLFYGGFILIFFSLISILIYTLIYKNYKCNIFHFIMLLLVIIGIIMPQFAEIFNLYYYFPICLYPNYKIKKALRQNPDYCFVQGVPNNSFSDFNFTFSDGENILNLNENKGIYFGVYNQKRVIINMRGWICKDRYIFEFLHTLYRIQLIKKYKISEKNIYKKIENKNIRKFILYIHHHKKTKKYIVSNERIIKSPVNLKLKNYKKSKFINDLKIEEFYSLNS